MSEVSWGEVTATSPLAVVFVGDSAESLIPLSPSGTTLAVGDRVALVRAGSSWGVICVWEASS